MVKISIIIPLYNTEKFVEECINSIIKQTYSDFEIICIDDCGTDNTYNIVKNINDSRIKIIKHNNNLGLAVARNTGISKAVGKYIFFIDSDDFLFDQFSLENLVQIAEKDDADIVLGKNKVFLNNLDCTDIRDCENLKLYLSPLPTKKYKVTKYNFAELISRFPSIAWGKLYKKEFIVKNNIFFINSNTIHEDEGFHLKILCKSPTVSIVNYTIINYRQRKNSITDCINKKNKKREKKKNLKKNFR